MMARLTLEDVLAATRVVARIMDDVGGAVAAAQIVLARAEHGDASGGRARRRLSLAAAAWIELENRKGVARRRIGQRRLLLAASAVCAVMAAAP